MHELLDLRKMSLVLEEDAYCSCACNNFLKEMASPPFHVFLMEKSNKGAHRVVMGV